MASPLFTLAASAVRRTAQEQFRRSSYAQLVNEVNRATTLPSRIRQQGVWKLLDKYRHRMQPESLIREVTGMQFGRFVRQIERYAKGGGSEQQLVDALLKELGPAGNLIKSLVGSGGIGRGSLQRELDSATRLLEAFGHVVIPPRGTPTVGQMRQGAQGLADYLQTQGYEVRQREVPAAPRPAGAQPAGAQPAGAQPAGGWNLPQGIPATTSTGQPRQVVDLPDPSGAVRVRVDDPMITGDFVSVDSSNVHSIAYDADTALLYVRFLAPTRRGKKRTAPGPLYQYRSVTPRQFQNLQRASSKGSWVWDHLRIRGTVSGHRKDYALVGVINGYVPRKATMGAGGQEWFIKRQLYVGKGRWLESELSDAPTGRGFSRGEPNTGAPQSPNTGSPRT